MGDLRLLNMCIMIMLALGVVSCEDNNGEPAPIKSRDFDIFAGLGCDDMVFVEGGTFMMGAQSNDAESVNYEKEAYEDESPVHQVTLDDFYIGKYEVTQQLWKYVMGNNPSSFIGENLPVESVSWNDCQEFIEKLNQMTGKKFRLPTEAEWEYVARGGDKSSGCKYSGSDMIEGVAWYTVNVSGNNGYGTHCVGGKLPNELGIYDMSGNVLEWCNDWYGAYSATMQVNPKGADSGVGRVLRGGCWLNYEPNCRVAYRQYGYDLNRRSYCNGLRLAFSE